MRKRLSAPQMLVVAADFSAAAGCESARAQVLRLADALRGSGIVIKVNSILRATGYTLIHELHDRYCDVFADLKLFDIGSTLTNDGELLADVAPEIVTVAADSGPLNISALKKALPKTEVLGVTVLTNSEMEEIQYLYDCSIPVAVNRKAEFARHGGCDGLVCAPAEVGLLREEYGDRFSLVTPNVRPAAMIIDSDDQNLSRAKTPGEAVRAGADRVIVGRPITLAADPYAAAMKIVEEIASVL